MSRPNRSALCLGLLALLCLPVATALARPAKVVPPSPQVRAAQLVGQGVMALATRDFVGAYRALAEAYRLQPSHDTLYQLGIIAWSEGQPLMAQDILRRYLADPGSEGATEKRAEAQRIVSQPARGTAEAWLSGSERSLVFVDDRLVGQLPLSLPLLLAPAAHRLRLEAEGRAPLLIEVTPGAGQILALRESGDRLLSQVLTKVLLRRTSAQTTSPAGTVERDRQRIATRLAAMELGLSTLPGDEPATSCDQSCVLSLAKEQAAELVISVSEGGSTGASSLTILDVVVGESAAQDALSSSDGARGDERWLAALPALLGRARARGRGVLQIDSTPAGCEVAQGDRVLGTTPLVRTLFVGPTKLDIHCAGMQSEHRQVEILASAPTVLALSLHPPPPPPVAPAPLLRQPRPVWRLALGAGAIAVGLGLGGLGVSALAVSGRCIEAIEPPVQACPRFYETTATGGALLGVGAALTVSGTLLLAWPGRRARSEVAQR